MIKSLSKEDLYLVTPKMFIFFFTGGLNRSEFTRIYINRLSYILLKNSLFHVFSNRENAKTSNKSLLETIISNAPEEIKRVDFEEVPQIASCQVNTMDSTDDLWMDVPINPPRVSPIGSPIRRVGGSVNIQTCSPCASDDNCGPDSDREELDLDLDYQVTITHGPVFLSEIRRCLHPVYVDRLLSSAL